jgi:DNA-binding CsgD family transcriptional regulator
MVDPVRQARARERLATLDLMGLTAVIVEPDRQVLGATGPGTTFLRVPPPLAMHNGRLMLRRTAEARRLAEAISTVLQLGVGGRAIVPIDSDHVLTLIRDGIDDVPAILILVSKRDLNGRICPHCLQQGFALTAREAEVAAVVAAGQPLQEAAATLGISLATARTHLRHIFQKTHVQTQSALIAFLAGCAFGRCERDRECRIFFPEAPHSPPAFSPYRAHK